MFFAYHHHSPVWHRLTAAGLGALAALFGAVSVLFFSAAVGDRDGPLGMGAVGAFFDDPLNEMLGVDGRTEAAVYLLSVGATA